MQLTWRNRRITNLIRHLLDDWLPPVIRERPILTRILARIFHGKHFDIEFKRKAFTMTEAEFADVYARLGQDRRGRYRLTDMTEGQLAWMTGEAIGPRVLEVGCGLGVLAERLLARGDLDVTATDLCPETLAAAQARLGPRADQIHWQLANGERLPFPDRHFDTTLAAHTLEHVRDFEKAVAELLRVTRRRLLVVVPCQRYYRYTVDYHLHFFAEPAQLVLRMNLPNYFCTRIDGDLCYRADIAEGHLCGGPP